MQHICRRVVVVAGVTAAMLGLSIGPAAAANTAILVNWPGTGPQLSIFPTSATINQGDTLTFGYTTQDPNSQLLVFDNATCSGPNILAVASSQADVTTPAASGTYSVRAQDSGAATSSDCDAIPVTVNSVPPPDVPEAPIAAALLGAGAVLFGGGFFVLRRRRARVA